MDLGLFDSLCVFPSGKQTGYLVSWVFKHVFMGGTNSIEILFGVGKNWVNSTCL